jgi:diguanylate cyclase (GGDEF)-like protein/PAS domain S-box-containing protein
VLEANRQSYWLTQLTNGPKQQITVVQPAAELIHALDFDLLLPCFGLMALVLIGGTLVSEVLGLLLNRQFIHILKVAQPGSGSADTRLTSPSFVRELNSLAKAIRFAISQLEASNTRYRSFFNLPIVGTAITSLSKGWVEVNEETCRILGYTRDELFRRTWAQLTHPDDLAADEEQFERMLRREIDGYELEKRFIRKDGTIVHTLLVGGCGPIGNQPVDLCYVNLIDITPRKQLEAELTAVNQRLQALATTDSLTGIWNRRQMEACIQKAIDRSDRHGDSLALILADIDNFKAINDRLGHSVGDEVLIEFCRRIQPHLCNGNAFCRWGGEEFLILLDHTDAPAARALAETFRQLIAGSPFPQVGTVTASFGVALRREQEAGANWIQRVDHQLYAAKEGGRNRVVGDLSGDD